MCLIAFNWNNHPQYKLMVIANRDEFYKRKTQSAHFWDENPALLAGKDLEAGGTWLGFHQSGRWSALTNYRDIANLKAVAPSRGMLTTNFTVADIHPEDYLKTIAPHADEYNGFNLLVGTLDELYYFSNYQNEIRKLEAGLYGLSNHLLDTNWYKVEKIKQNFSQAIQSNRLKTSDLLELLYNPEKPTDNRVQQTGLPFERERMLSPMFIESPEYGTCSSAVILLDYDNQVTFHERLYNAADKQVKEQIFRFKVEAD
jgi:uncharacterized protein with NRDE domain